MTPQDQDRLLQQLKTDEGCVLRPYTDSLGFMTIGYGRMIDPLKGGKISADEAAYLLANDVKAVVAELTPFAWFHEQDSVRQAALGNMAFNLGLTGLLHFPRFLGSMQIKDYPGAVSELANTPWRRQVGARADRIIQLIETGAWP